jgi:DNA polymerase-1
MSDAKPIILVDFSAIAWACWHSAEAANKADPKYDSQEVLKTNLRHKMATIEEYTGCIPSSYVMVTDSHARWKYQAYPGYKGTRDRDKFDPRAWAEAYLREAYPTIQWVRAPGHEADDAIAALAWHHSESTDDVRRPVVIVSGDKDLWQLLKPGVKIFRPTTKKFVTLEDVEKEFGFSNPRYIRLHKALWGDPSDNLPNCAPRMQKQLMPLIQAADGDLLNMLKLLDGNVNATCLGHLKKNEDQVVINWLLTRLDDGVELEWR